MIAYIVIGIIGAAIIIMLCAYKSAPKESTVDNNTSTATDIERLFPISRCDSFRIAGISHYCSKWDVGRISGECRFDPDNEYDKDAIMIIEANKGKIIGHISRADQKRYRKLVDNIDHAPFVGFIETFENDRDNEAVYGIIRVYIGEEKTVCEDLNNEWDFLGKAYKITDHEKRINVLEQFKWDKH